jgi:hypothetical protein
MYLVEKPTAALCITVAPDRQLLFVLIAELIVFFAELTADLFIS